MLSTRAASFRLLPVILAVVAALAATGCHARTAAIGPTEVNVTQTTSEQPSDPAPGLQFRLSEGVEQPPPQSVLPPAPAQPLERTALQRLLDRLPPLQAQEGDQQELNLPKETLPAPRPGKTIKESFPPPPAPTAAPEAESGPLEVLRYAPEGEVGLAANLSVTFNQPMVALTGVGDLARLDVPVRLSPQPEGQWRWVGTKTLVFEPAAKTGFSAGRFPAATKYSVEIPAGTASATGGKLAQGVAFSFTTPPPTIDVAAPKDTVSRRDAIVFVSFNQRISQADVLETITVKAGNKTFPVRLASQDEIKADEGISNLVNNAQENRWLAVRTNDPLPVDSAVTVTVGPGTPSAEGPLKSTAAQSFSFRTYGPLRVLTAQCGWGGDCTPLMPWQIQFSNPLDRSSITADSITVDPALPALALDFWGETVQIRGQSKGRTTYKITLDASIGDIFGQTLGESQTKSITVGSSEPAMQLAGGDFVVLDPLAAPALSVYTMNYSRLHVSAYAVAPEDWGAFKTYLAERRRTDRPPAIPGRQVYDKTVAIEMVTDQLTETAIDLQPAFRSAQGHLVVIVKPERTGLPALLPGRRSQDFEDVVWVQRTEIGLDAFTDAGQMVAWANSLRDGSPMPGVALSLWPAGATATTEGDGTAALQLPAGRAAQLLVAKAGDQIAILPANLYHWGDEGWLQQPLNDGLQWYVFDDRKMYRPGEEVHVKGWVRRWGAGPRGDIGPLAGAAESITYRLQDSRGNEVASGRADLNELGGFDFSFELSDVMNLGYAYLQVDAIGGAGVENRSWGHQIQVQEFRRPEFEVKVTASEGPHFIGGSATLDVAASYYAGGGLPNAPAEWSVTTKAGSYSPPGWDEFTFGRWVPWWRLWWSDSGRGTVETGKSFSGITDAAGVHRLKLDFDAVVPAEPTSVHVEATVNDVNRQAWTGSTDLLVHPATLYVGLRTDRMFVEREEPLAVEVIVTDLDGKPAAGVDVQLSMARLEWTWQDDGYQEQELKPQPCAVKSKTEPVTCTFETPEGGTYRIRATVVDAAGHPNLTELTRWVSGGERVPSRVVEQEDVTLVPDKKEHQPGETAEILVQAPFYPAEGLLTLRRSGIVSSERFTMEGPSTTLRIPIQEGYTPNITVQVDLVGAAERGGDAAADPGRLPASALPKRPAYARGELSVTIPPLSRTLNVQAVPAAGKVEPGGSTELDVTVTDAQGNPIEGAELAVAVVDEAVLALTGYDIPDPITAFYSDRGAGVTDYHNRGYIVLASPDQLQLREAVASADMAAGAAATMAPAAAPMPQSMAVEKAVMNEAESATPETPISVRTDFNPLAHWSPAVSTDAAGRAAFTIKAPDNLTRYRIMVVAVAGGKQFGKGESSLTARLPLMVRPSAPRFLNFGDKFDLPVVVQNQTDDPLTVDVAVRGANISLTEGQGRRVTVPANDRVEVRFPATTVSAGTARLQIAAASGKWADAASVDLPVYTPATTEAFAVYGVLDEGSVAQPVIAPTDVYTQFGGLEITTSSTALQALTDAFLYLVAYPFECSEQLASRILAVAALRDVLTAFQATGLPPADQIEAAMARDLERLAGMQNDDGGFAIWKRGDDSWPYHTVHVTHALQAAKLKGYAVNQDVLNKAGSYLQNIEARYPAWYGESVRSTLSAYALYVRDLMGDSDVAKARKLLADNGLEKLSPEAIGWLLSVLSDDSGSIEQVAAIRRHLLNRVTETAGAAHFVSSYGDQEYVLLYSNRRGDGVILNALIGDQPDSDLIPKLVAGLLGGRTAGRWGNTQENAFILLALDRYFNTYEAQTPDFVARIWLGEQYAGETAFRGRTTDYKQVDVPMRFLAGELAGEQDLVIAKDGPGRLYYRLGLRYAPLALELPPYDAGFTVERTYEAIDDPADVQRDANGDWTIKAGARVRVKLTMVAPTRRYHVALTDPLPAGLESLNPALATTGSLPAEANQPASKRGYWWWGPWYEHQNLRDQRAEAFASTVWAGVHSYTYIARATTPGRFVVPPAKAEEMYAPETFGRSAGDIVVVK